MTAQQLKNSILQMAVQGKLVPQDPNDEPASVLLERIRAEKEQLIKEKKIKREKNPSVIFRGADNIPYEKIGDEVRSLEDEVPFDIPDSWEWVRLGSISDYAATKQKINAQSASPDLWGLDLEDIERGGRILSFRKVGERKAVGDKTVFHKGDVLYSKLRPYLLKILVAPNDGICTSEIVPFRVFGGIIAEYVVSYLKCPSIDFLINSITYGVKMPRVGTDTMVNLLIPVPPVAEQRRILDKLKELEPIVEKYRNAAEEAELLSQAFPDRLRKSILQMAVQGKLVPQDPADEPAKVLLERIRAEKERLIKEGKIKKDKHESVIFRRDNSHYEKCGSTEVCIDDEIPFDIPDTWEWVRMASLVQVNPRNFVPDDWEVGFIPMNLIKEGFNNTHTFEQRTWSEVKSGFTHFANQDVVIAKITPCFQNRKSAIISGLPNGVGAGTTELHVLRDPTHIVFMPYLLLLCKSQDFISKGISNFTGTAGQQRVGKAFIANYLVPLPPVEEQKRIVETASRIFNKIESLNA